MSTPASTINIPNDVLQPIINAHVAGAIEAALGNRSELIAEAVRAALTAKVDGEGKTSGYAHSGSLTFLQWLVNKSIRDAATAALKDILAADAEHIKAAVTKEIRNQRSPLTKSLIEGIAKAAADSARFNIKVLVDGVERER